MAKSKNITPVYDLVLNQGEDSRIQLQISNQVDTTESPMNLDGYAFTCKVREKAEDREPILTAKCTILDKLHGLVEIYFKAPDTTQLLLDGSYYEEMSQYTYDVFMQDGRGDEQRILCGSCFISPSVSNR